MTCKIWTLDRIADKVENPLRYDYCALITSYNPEYEGLKVDRPLRDGEVVDWEGLKLHIDWMPGQTEFGNCLWLELDGKRIAFTGDNLFGDPADPAQNGHEAVVARNSAIFEEGYLLGSRYLRDLKPDIVMGAHNVLMANPAAFLDRYHEWSQADHHAVQRTAARSELRISIRPVLGFGLSLSRGPARGSAPRKSRSPCATSATSRNNITSGCAFPRASPPSPPSSKEA